MQVKIGRKVYDTEKSKEIGKQTISYFGDSYGFEEIMFEKATDDFFLLVNGGEDSQYPEEAIIPLSVEDAKNWIERVCGHEYAEQIIPTKTEEKTTEVKPATAKPAAAKAAAKPTAAKTTATKAAATKKPAAKKATTTKRTTTATKPGATKTTEKKTETTKK
ncbi:MAG: hypothetical protein ACOX2M_06895 [Fastidiosipilaceae bacterium]|jgi:hypothetical protein